MADGYNPDFIGDGIRVPLPTFDTVLGRSILRKPGVLRKDIYSDHINFSIVMNEHTNQLVYSAFNMDQNQLRPLGSDKGKRSWRKATDIGDDNQLGNEFYKDRTGPSGQKISNPYDRGHMVMRHNAMWGPTDAAADKAGKATFTYANSSLQHMNLNRDEWLALETDVVRAFADTANGKLIVFTGPIWGDLDRSVHLSDTNSARVPSGFFKVICYRTTEIVPSKRLGVKAFAIFQDERVLRDRRGGATVKTDRRYQFTISEIQDMTGINFGDELYTRNPLFYHNRSARNKKYNVSGVPERIPIGPMGDVVVSGDDKRCRIEQLAERRIVIHAAMIDPKGNETRNEWVSLFNRGNRKVNMTGWRLVDGHGREAKISDAVGAGEMVKLKGRKKGKVKLANTGGSLVLYDDHNCIIDHVTWSKHDLKRVEEGMAYMFERGQ